MLGAISRGNLAAIVPVIGPVMIHDDLVDSERHSQRWVSSFIYLLLLQHAEDGTDESPGRNLSRAIPCQSGPRNSTPSLSLALSLFPPSDFHAQLISKEKAK